MGHWTMLVYIIMLSCLPVVFATAPKVSVLTVTNFSVGSFVAPAFLTNGFIGLRPGPALLVPDPFAGAAASPTGFDPTVPCTVAGFLHRDVSLHRVLSPAPYPFVTDVFLDGTKLLGAETGAKNLRVVAQSLNMSTGELMSQLEINTSSVKVYLNVTAFLSRTSPTLAVMRVSGAVHPLGVHNLSLAPVITLDTIVPYNNLTVPAVTYNTTVPDLQTMPGWANWV
jgi:hypothetical protein